MTLPAEETTMGEPIEPEWDDEPEWPDGWWEYDDEPSPPAEGSDK